MAISMYHPVNRVINELNHRINNMPRYAGEMVQFVQSVNNSFPSYFPRVEFNNVILAPRVDAIEDTNAYMLVVELAGVAKEDVKITVKERVLTISGEKKRSETPEGVTFLAKGRRFGQFERSFELPETASTDGIAAEFANGVLTLTLPKVAVKQPETISVEIK
jgi:HSP20 family protein